MDLPRLVLVPGLDGTGLLFAPFLQAWPGPTTVVSLPPDPTLGYEGLQLFLESVLPVGESYVLLGESFSGPLVLRIAEAPPPGLLGIVLCVTFARYPLGSLGGLARLLARPRLLSCTPRWFLRRRLLGREESPELIALLQGALRNTSTEVIASRIRALTLVDATPALRACHLPLLLLSARADAVVPSRCTAHLLRHAAQAEWQEFPGPHLLLQTRPAAAAAAVLDFMKAHDLVTSGQ